MQASVMWKSKGTKTQSQQQRLGCEVKPGKDENKDNLNDRRRVGNDISYLDL